MILVLDNNIWISLVINRQMDLLIRIKEAGIEIATCFILRSEMTDVLSRPKVMKLVDPELINQIILLHDRITKSYNFTEIEDVVADQKDNYLFALCLAAHAGYLVTGDKLLLNEAGYKNTKVISLSALKLFV
jgi:putative PIN family toxin of toxin-antitoxin system